VEAGIALATLRVEDPELRSPPRRPEAVADDHHLRSLADDVPAEPDPGPSGELQPEAGRLPERLSKARREVRRLEEDEHRVGAPGEGGDGLLASNEPSHVALPQGPAAAGAKSYLTMTAYPGAKIFTKGATEPTAISPVAAPSGERRSTLRFAAS